MNQIDVNLGKEADIWADDRLGFADIGQSFTNIIQTIDDSKVISVEAPFGYGKTFFRERWAKQLKAAGELVIEIDALQSDHSGDPLVTFVGALLSATPRSGEPIKQSTKEKFQKWGGILGRATLKAVLREGAEEIISAGADWAQGEAPDIEGIDKAVDALKDGLSSAAAQMIATHLAAEEARKVELPAQIDALRDALTEGSKNKRIVIIVDELDRCQPEYAISLLEAMKLVFGRKGFVFVLMVNPNYLEDVARHRFGTGENDELYLEKFIDFRLKLPASSDGFKRLAEVLMSRIQIKMLFGDEAIFGILPATELLQRLHLPTYFSTRRLVKLIQRIDLVVRCNPDKYIDLPLLTYLAIKDAIADRAKVSEYMLPRAGLLPESPRNLPRLIEQKGLRDAFNEVKLRVAKNYPELANLSDSVYRSPTIEDGRYNFSEYKVLMFLAPHYIPSHQAMLDGVARLQAD